MNEWSGMRATSRTLARLSEARLHGVTPEYIRSLADLGYADLPLEQYIELLTHGITPEYIREMRDGGYIDLSPHDLIQLRVSGVNPDYVRDMIDLGFGARDSVPAAHNQAGSVESEER